MAGAAPAPEWLDWEIDGLAAKIRDAKAGGWRKVVLLSPHFATRSWYTVAMYICLNGDKVSDAGHVSVFVQFVHSPRNANLRWPFRGKVTVACAEVEGWQDGEVIDTAKGNDRRGTWTNKPPTDGSGPPGRGWTKYLSHAQLGGLDSITLRVKIEPEL